MKKRVILTSVVSFVLLAAVIAAGLNAVYTVSYINAVYLTFSEAGDAEAQALRLRLDEFIGKSTTFLDLADVESVVSEYPCFRVEKIEKNYPDTLALTIAERKEAFSYVQPSGGYAILDEEGYYLFNSMENVSRTGDPNIVLTGFSFDLKIGNTVGGSYSKELLETFLALKEVLSEVRANVLSVSLVCEGSPANPNSYLFRIEMREGVAIELVNPSVKAGEKALAAVQYYAGVGEYEGCGLSDLERTAGVITVVNSETGEVIAPDYARFDD